MHLHYLITGGAGFIGSHLALRLLAKGMQVTVLDNYFSSSPAHLAHTGARLIKGSVLHEKTVHQLVTQCDQVIHLAAVVGVPLAMGEGREGLKVSLLGTENVLNAATQENKEVFIASSSAIYGKIRHSPVAEDDDILLGSTRKASWLYSVAKLAEEHLSLAYYREAGTKVKIGRFFNVIGPHQTGAYGMVVPNFVTKALRKEPLLVYGTGQQTRTFGYIEDILDGLELVLEKGKYGDIYNIGGQEEVTILQLAEKIKKLTLSSSPIILLPYEEVFGGNFEETQQRVPDISRLKKLGYRPRYSLDQALMKIIEYHRSGEQ